jgi:hypothetical protein
VAHTTQDVPVWPGVNAVTSDRQTTGSS